jgi:hypothetical protein
MSAVGSFLSSAVTQVIKSVPWRSVERWVTTKRLPPARDGKYNVILLDLVGDHEGTNARHVERAIRALDVDVYRVGRALPVQDTGSAQDNELAARTKLGLVMARYNADIAIWGAVLESGRTLELRVSCRAERSDTHAIVRLSESFDVSPSFSEAFVISLICECSRQILEHIDNSSVNDIHNLESGLRKIKTLFQEGRFRGDEKQHLDHIYKVGCLTAFDCTLNVEWLAYAVGGLSTKSQLVSELPELHLRSYTASLLRASQFIYTLSFSRALIESLHLLMYNFDDVTFQTRLDYARSLRLWSHLQSNKTYKRYISRIEWSVYRSIILDPLTPEAVRLDCRHLQIGLLRDVAVVEDRFRLLELLSRRCLKLPDPLSREGARDHLESCLEFAFRFGRSDWSTAARRMLVTLDTNLSKQDKLLAYYLKIQKVRYACQASGFGLTELEHNLDDVPLSAHSLSILSCIARSEVKLRRAQFCQGLEKMKRLKISQIDAVSAREMAKFGSPEHTSIYYAKARFKAAAQQLDALKGELTD